MKAKIHLVAAISSREYREDFVSEKVSDWVSEVVQLAKFAERRAEQKEAKPIQILNSHIPVTY